MFPIPTLPPVLKRKLKAEKEADKKAKVDPKLQAKKSLRNSAFYIPYQREGQKSPEEGTISVSIILTGA